MISSSNAEKVVLQDAKRDLRTQFKFFLDQTGLDARQAATACGIFNEETIIKYLADEPIEDRDGVEAAIRDLLGLDDQPIEATLNLQGVFDICRYALRRKRIAAVSGEAGYGKTTALKLFCRTSGSIYYCYDEVSGARDALRQLCKRAGLPNRANNGTGHLLSRLTDELRKNPRLLVIDQFDTAPFRLVEALRSLHDNAHCPIVFAGLQDRLLERLLRRNSRENAAQVFSRVAAHISLPAPTKEDVALIAADYHVTGERALAFLHERAAVGGYRHLRILCEDAADVAAESGRRKITLDVLEKAASYLISTNPKNEEDKS